MNRPAALILCLLCIHLTACKTSSKATTTNTAAPVPVKPAEEAKTKATDMLNQGYSVYQGKCGGCHNLPNPGDYDQSDWASIMIRMSRKAHLSSDETAQVLAFVNANAKHQ
jgi:cytochrome c5